MDNRLTDFSFFKQNSFGDNELYKELVSIFMRTTPEMVGQLLGAFAEKDFDVMAKVAHKLKSNVQSVGLGQTHQILDRLENTSWGPHNERELQSYLHEVEHSCTIAVAEAEKELTTM